MSPTDLPAWRQKVSACGKLKRWSEKLAAADRVIVPVQVIGDQDGAWDRTAWKTDAFYGNPLKGFSVP